ncbi:MAG: hypothetical protein OZSIB_1729 [Candidatus Ozemobacter sibiricus]|uniref:Uncharacterized protein n=1 Tax=Candidatus Ozemobacter sibiricus TaxID=2268124 RepID=A0A367ZJA3_9BACT|nr:MAG: hypothetical protein OZSIB_1729 [Candidatus Ozemobacter sibiricus]
MPRVSRRPCARLARPMPCPDRYRQVRWHHDRSHFFRS